MASGAAGVLGSLLLQHGLLEGGHAQPSKGHAIGEGIGSGKGGRQGSDEVPWQNWSGLQKATPSAFAIPADEAALRQTMQAMQGEIRMVGAGHSFAPLVPTSGAIVSLDPLSGVVSVDKKAMTVTLQAGTRLGVLARALDEHGLALRNLPDIDAQSMAGAISTGTHGTGAALPALHADVVGLRIVAPGGRVHELHDDKDRDAMAAAMCSSEIALPWAS